METAQPRGVQEQVSAITDLIDGGPEEVREDENQAADVNDVPEQAASGESLEADAVEAGGEAAEAEAEQQQEVGEIRTVAEFAQAAGWSPEEMYALSVRLDNGEEIPLGQMKDALQTAARERAELSAARENLAQHYQRLQQVEQSMLQGKQQISQELQEAQAAVIAVQERYSAIDWDQLAQTDPGRAALLQQQIASEYAGAKQNAAMVEQKQSYVQQQVLARMVQENNERFLSAVPEWRNPEVATKEAAELDGFLMQKVGFAPQELQSIIDARMRVVALMALRWYQHQSSVAKVAGKVRNAPRRVVTPGHGNVAPSGQRKLTALVQKAKTTQKRGDQVAAVNALLNAS
jgi:hypothetical protein